MARRMLLRHPQAPAHLIEVEVKWPLTTRTHPPSPDCDTPRHNMASRTELQENYRHYRQRLADALRPR